MRIDWRLFISARFWLAIGLGLLFAGFYLLTRPTLHLLAPPEILEIIEAKTLDMRFCLRGQVSPSDAIVIVAVDEKTEDALGRWQSSGREWIAKLLDTLREGNARLVGFDLTFSEPDERRDLDLLEHLAKHYEAEHPEDVLRCGELLTHLNAAAAAFDHDRQLANALERAGNVILGIYFLDAAAAAHLTPDMHRVYQEMLQWIAYENITPPGSRIVTYHASGVEANLPMFSDAALSFGHFNVMPDRDGAIRFVPMIEEYAGKYYPSLDLEIVRAALNPSLPPFIRGLGAAQIGMAGIALGDRVIPTDDAGNFLINYYGPAHTFPYYSLSDVVQGKIPAYKFTEKIVLVGFTSKIIRDLHAVPFQAQDYPGVEIHATAIENMLRGRFLTRSGELIWSEAAAILAIGLLLSIARHQKSALWEICAALFCIAVIAGAAYLLFVFANIWVNVTYPLLFIVMDYLAITSYSYFVEERQKRIIRNAFQHYVSPRIVEHLLNHLDQLNLVGERKELTAFFSDIRGFTSISEHLPPDKLVEFLNEYLSEMAQIVMRYEGTVDKYMGDAMMAFYGAPVNQTDHAVRACKTAVDMMVRLKELQVAWEARGLPHMDIGIGLNSGEMSVGNMGSGERFDYTIMGDNVNLASRLEGANKQYGTHIIISGSTYALWQAQSPHEALTARELDRVRVKGKTEPVTIYELIGYGHLYAQKQPLIARFSEGLATYKARQWAEAIERFQAVLTLDPHDTPSKIYIERCQLHQETPPPEDWDGVFVMKTK